MKSILYACATLVCLFLLTIDIQAQGTKGGIRGEVRTSDGERAASVGIRLTGTAKQTITDEAGNFRFRDVAAGTYELEVMLMGHETLRQSVTVMAGQQAQVKLQLSASQKTLQEVIVTSGVNRFARKESESSTRMPLKNLENPQVYSVVGADLMKEQITIDYRDAIRNIPGVNSTELVSNGRTSTIIRGFRTGSFIRNGLSAYQLVTVDPANLESIEVLKGPSGTLFGTGAASYGGAVNRVTKKPFDTYRTELAFTAGSFGLNRVTADINTPLNSNKTALLRVNLGRHASGSFQESGFRQNYFLAAAFGYQANDRLSFLVDLELFRNHGTAAVSYISPNAAITNWKQMEEFYYRTFSSNDVVSTFPGYNLYAQMNYKLSGKWTSSTLFSTGGVNARNQTQFSGTMYKDSLTRRIQRYSHNYETIQVQQNINGEFQTGGIRHRVLIGADYLADITQPTYLMAYMYDTIKLRDGKRPMILKEQMEQRLAQTPVNDHYSSHTDRYGVYVADAINFTDRLLLMLSVRWDKVDNRGTFSYKTGLTTGAYTKSSFSPKGGMVYQLVKDQLSAFVNYMNGFNYRTGQDKNGNPFKPEQANQWEGGFKAELLDNRLTATLSAYDITVTDVLRQDPENLNFSIQDGTQNSKGVELELIANPLAGLNLTGGYGFNESVFKKAKPAIEGKRPGRSGGKHMANLWASYRITGGKVRGLGLGAGVIYNSETPFNDENTLFFPAYAIANATVFYDRPGYRVGVKLDNISNVKYWGPWGEPQLPRNYAVNLIVKL